jgi:SAM-dependent methyltransferase
MRFGLGYLFEEYFVWILIIKSSGRWCISGSNMIISGITEIWMSTRKNDPENLEKQYQDVGNLNARILLHQRSSANPYGWQRWVFDHFQLPDGAHVLEVGCGPGNLWLENLDRLPPSWQITLVDFSPGMLAQAQANLSDLRAFDYQVVNANNPPLPFETCSFDAVIANHMIYHLSNKEGFFSEIRRIIKSAGVFYASTNGFNHLLEITDLLQRYIDSFTLENGQEQLAGWFNEVTLERYEDELNVTDAGLLADYILSGLVDLDEEDQDALRNFILGALRPAGGSFHITKDGGMFMAK